MIFLLFLFVFQLPVRIALSGEIIPLGDEKVSQRQYGGPFLHEMEEKVKFSAFILL